MSVTASGHGKVAPAAGTVRNGAGAQRRGWLNNSNKFVFFRAGVNRNQRAGQLAHKPLRKGIGTSRPILADS